MLKSFAMEGASSMTAKLVQRISLMASATVFTLLSGLAIAPHSVQAKPATATTEKPASPSGTTQDSESGTLMKELNLTEQQKKDIKLIRRNRTMAINKVLTPDQQTKFKQARASGKTTSQAITEMNLKPDQKKQIMDIMQKSATEIKSKLTKTQLTTLTDYMRKHSGKTAAVE
jgi:Spy/CpxP family protein refolding chaperone